MNGASRRVANVHAVNRLLASPREMPGHVAGVPAGVFWPALLLTIIDTRGSSLCALLRLTRPAFDGESGELRIGHVAHVLHPTTVQAINSLQAASAPYQRGQLFPWPFDTLPHLKTLRKHLCFLRRRVWVPSEVSFFWLRRLRKSDPHILGRIDVAAQFELDPNVRTIGREFGFANVRPQGIKPTEGIHALHVPPQISLVRFFEDMYAPLKLADGTEDTRDRYRSTLQKLIAFTGCEPHFGCLQDEFCDRFTVWMTQHTSLGPATVNVHLRHLTALWRYAWKKRKVAELPPGRHVPPHSEALSRLLEHGRIDPVAADCIA